MPGPRLYPEGLFIVYRPDQAPRVRFLVFVFVLDCLLSIFQLPIPP